MVNNPLEYIAEKLLGSGTNHRIADPRKWKEIKKIKGLVTLNIAMNNADALDNWLQMPLKTTLALMVTLGPLLSWFGLLIPKDKVILYSLGAFPAWIIYKRLLGLSGWAKEYQDETARQSRQINDPEMHRHIQLQEEHNQILKDIHQVIKNQEEQNRG